MIKIEVKEDRTSVDYDYVVSSLTDLDERMKTIYKPILGTYAIGLYLDNITDIKFLLNNKSKYNHINLHLTLTENIYKKISLAMPGIIQEERRSMFDYLVDGIAKRNLLIKKNIVYTIYSSIGKSYEEIDDLLDLLSKSFGPFMQINEKDISKYLVINNIVYPRTVLINYINLERYRKSKLQKCLSDISHDIVLASMVKQVKKLHEQKVKYLNSGLGNKFIRNLNTRNLNLMYYILVVSKPYNLNDVTILLELYERGLNINDLLL